MTNKQLKLYREQQDKLRKELTDIILEVRTHPAFEPCQEKVDSYHRTDYYESGSVIGISPTRKGFDDLYRFNHCYRGGLIETKVGDNYVIYGFEFD